jgi:putative acetyltransferase
VIRPYVPDDIDAVLDVWYRASQVAHAFLTEEFLALEREQIRTVYLPATRTWVCERDGAVVGFISLHDNEVGGLFVAPEHHGHGLGRALMDRAREEHAVLEVEVFEANAIGRAFYERYGFTFLHRHVHEETGQPSLRLRYAGSGSP